MLPSDVARLVLGYLKDEGLLRSYKEFFTESPHLEELRRHPNVEPSVPFEKGLPEILSEYSKLINAIKDRKNCNQVIASLWKMHSEVIGQLRFQYTGNAGLLHTQTHPEPRKVDQRTLTRYRMSALRKQQELQRKMASQLPSKTTTTTTAPNAAVSGSVSVATSPLDALTNSIMIAGRQGHTANDHRVMGSTNQGSEVEMEVADHRGQDLETTAIPEFRTPTKGYSVTGTQVHTPIGKSPKRKSVPPRRLPASTAASISPRSTDNVSSSQMEEEFPDLPQVLESLINNTEFQEKLAGNINKKLPVENRSEPVGEANTSTHTLSTSSTSIEELLNLQMTDDTVHEIVQSTSADPAFESLFSLFNIDREQYNRSFQENLEDAPTHHEPTVVDLTTTSNATMTQPNNVPNITGQSLQSTPLSNQSHYISDQGTGQVTYSLANQNPQVVAGSTMLTTANTGPFTSLSIQPPVTSASTGTHHQLNLNPSAIIPSTDQVVTLPVFLNASGQYQIMQQAVPSPQNLVVNSPVGFQGGTLLVTPDGRVVGSPSVAIQSGQQLLPGSLAQNKSSGQGSTHQQSNADPSCPVHGRMENLNAPPATGNTNLPTAPTPSLMTQVNGAQNVQDQTEVVQLLATMVDSDVGSLFATTSPERSFSRSNSPLTLTQTSHEIAKQKKTCFPENSVDASQNAKQNRLPDGNGVGQRAKQRTILPAPGQPNQTAEGNRNIFSSISNAAVVNPGPAGMSLVQQAGMMASEASVPTTKSPPGVASKPRKQIQFKGLTRTLDVGWTPEVQSRTRQPHKGNVNDNAGGNISTSESKSRGKNTNTDSLQKKKPFSSGLSKSTVVEHNKQVPDAVAHRGAASVEVPDDMSTEVNIAAQMLVCLSNSPPSLRQSPYRQQRLRSMTSNSSPATSPSRDWVMELRKEIGLSPNSGRLKRPELEASTQESQKDTKSSKRKSRTPRKQANTATETVVVTLQTEPKSKTAVQTRAATQKAKSPRKVGEDPVAKRKSSRSTNSSKKPDGAHGGDAERGAAEKGDKTLEETGKKENRGHKRNREGNTKDETSKKPKTTKSAKKTKRSQSFPSNLDVDKFLSSLQYAE